LCKTFGTADLIRVPNPAARTTTATAGASAGKDGWLVVLSVLGLVIYDRLTKIAVIPVDVRDIATMADFGQVKDYF